MGVGPIRKRTAALDVRSEDRKSTCGISAGFPALSPTFGQVTQLVLTSSPLGRGRSPFLVRLACLIHSEPGSNSPLESCRQELASPRGAWPLTFGYMVDSLEGSRVPRLVCPGGVAHLRSSCPAVRLWPRAGNSAQVSKNGRCEIALLRRGREGPEGGSRSQPFSSEACRFPAGRCRLPGRSLLPLRDLSSGGCLALALEASREAAGIELQVVSGVKPVFQLFSSFLQAVGRSNRWTFPARGSEKTSGSFRGSRPLWDFFFVPLAACLVGSRAVPPRGAGLKPKRGPRVKGLVHFFSGCPGATAPSTGEALALLELALADSGRRGACPRAMACRAAMASGRWGWSPTS